LIYQFISEGPNGLIKKIIQFQIIDIDANLYNLAFGDWDDLTKRIDDLVVSNNRDKQKVLATEAFAIMDFMRSYPDAVIFAQGITDVRARVYQIGISLFLREITDSYKIIGYVDMEWELFTTGVNYEAFLLSNK
jgi:hypothetical protein